jgi:hypothetical protein
MTVCKPYGPKRRINKTKQIIRWMDDMEEGRAKWQMRNDVLAFN